MSKNIMKEIEGNWNYERCIKPEHVDYLIEQNKRYREAFANAGIEAIERGAMTLDEDMPDDKEKAYRLGALDMLEDFTDFYLRELGVGK